MTLKKRCELIVWLALAFLLGLVATRVLVSPAHGQAWQPPYCTGPNAALQYNAQGWLCAVINVTPLPAQPLPTECITAHWDGTKWNCVTTQYLTTGVDVQNPTRRSR